MEIKHDVAKINERYTIFCNGQIIWLTNKSTNQPNIWGPAGYAIFINKSTNIKHVDKHTVESFTSFYLHN